MNLKQIPFWLQIFLVTLVSTSIFFYLVYPAIEPTIAQNYIVFFLVWTFGYSYMVWQITKSETALGKTTINKISFFVMIMLILFNWDLLQFPFLVSTNGVLSNLDAGAKISSDVFVHDILPTSIPEIVKYGIIYSLVPSLSLAIVAILAGSKKKFNTIAQRGF